jgi:thiol-disulfide isomerase/thioredoxin
MIKNKLFVIAAVLLLSGSAGVWAKPADKTKAPSFTIVLSDGTKKSLSDYAGKTLLLHFWATWCPPCVHELPLLDALAKKTAGRKDFAFLAVCVSDTESSRAAFMKKNGYTFSGGLDTNDAAAYAYGIQAIPASFLISPDGIILESYVGALPESKLAELNKLYGAQ